MSDVTMEAETGVGPLLAELRQIIDQREELARQDKTLSERRQLIERQLLDFHKSSGLLALGDSALGVTFDPSAMRATYEPEHWPAIAKWAADTGNIHIIQRRLSDGKVMELIDNGVALPPGLGVESYVKISVRRK